MSATGLDNDQAATRRPGTLYDQHVSPEFPRGRTWHASIDKKSGYPVGVIQPKGWRAPWLPDMSAFVFSAEDQNTFRIDYERLLETRLQSHKEYDASWRQAALVRGWDPRDPEKQANLEELVGPKPLPAEVIAAAMQGNRRVLGLTDKPDVRVEAFLPKRADRQDRLMAGMPDFSDMSDDNADVQDDEFNSLMDLEESVDPDRIGGKKVPVTRKRKAA